MSTQSELPADVRLHIDRQVTREAECRATPTSERQIAEAVGLATEWYTTAMQHGIDHDMLGWVGSLTSSAIDAVKLRDHRDQRNRP